MGSNLKFSNEKYLTLCGRIERNCAAIYEHWSNDPEHGEEAQIFWRTMQHEENEHYEQIQILKRVTRGQTFGMRKLSDEHVTRLAVYAEQCLDRIKKTSLSVRDALSMAIQLECLFSEFHVLQAFECHDKELEKMFKNLSRNDSEHAERLRATYKKLFSSEPPVCQTEFSQLVSSVPQA